MPDTPRRHSASTFTSRVTISTSREEPMQPPKITASAPAVEIIPARSTPTVMKVSAVMFCVTPPAAHPHSSAEYRLLVHRMAAWRRR